MTSMLKELRKRLRENESVEIRADRRGIALTVRRAWYGHRYEVDVRISDNEIDALLAPDACAIVQVEEALRTMRKARAMGKAGG